MAAVGRRSELPSRADMRALPQPLHELARMGQLGWHLIGHPRVIHAVDVSGIVKPEQRHPDCVALVIDYGRTVSDRPGKPSAG